MTGATAPTEFQASVWHGPCRESVFHPESLVGEQRSMGRQATPVPLTKGECHARCGTAGFVPRHGYPIGS